MALAVALAIDTRRALLQSLGVCECVFPDCRFWTCRRGGWLAGWPDGNVIIPANRPLTQSASGQRS
jgi:hypothetical protein